MRGTRISYTVLGGNPEGMRSLWSPRHRW